MKSGELSELSIMTQCSQSVCERCGGPFTCGAQSAGCWCAEVKLSDEVLAGLREQYKGCLCRACLKEIARRDAVPGEAEKILVEAPPKASV